MDREIRDKWIESLTNKRYIQGQGRLKSIENTTMEYKYCCLGVLCGIFDPNRWVEEQEIYYYEGNHISVPNHIKLEIFLDQRDENTLIGMNDSGETFEKIANWIEKNL